MYLMPDTCSFVGSYVQVVLQYLWIGVEVGNDNLRLELCLLRYAVLIFTDKRSVAYRGGFGGFKLTPLPKFRRPSKIVPNSTRLCKLLKIAEFRTATPQDIREKGSKILKLPRFAIVLHQQW